MAPRAAAGKAVQQAPPTSSRSQRVSSPTGQKFAPAPAFSPFSTVLGNQAMLSLLQSSQIQAKLRGSHPGDADEIEADRVANEVVSAGSSGASSPRPILPIFAPSAGALHRKCACSGTGTKCAQCEEEELESGKGIHRKASPGPNDTSVAPDTLLRGLGAGRALEPPLRKSMESRFGQDFSGVRIHDDPAAAQSAKSINAQAYTSGSHIYFGSGGYSPQSNEGQRLLAHELTHVVQQSGCGALVSPAFSTKGSVIQRAPSTPAAVPSLPSWLQGVPVIRNIQGNIYEINLSGYGPTEVGPYSELSTYLAAQGRSGREQAHHIVGNEHLGDLKTAYNNANAPSVALENGTHGAVSARITSEQNVLGGRHGGRPVVTAKDVASLYREVYSVDTKFKELATISDNVLGAKAKVPTGGPGAAGAKKSSIPPPEETSVGKGVASAPAPAPVQKPVAPVKSTGTATAAEILEAEKSIAQMKTRTAESIRFTGRIRIYTAALGALLELLNFLDAIDDAMKIASEGTILGPAQRQAEKIETQGREAVQQVESLEQSISFLAAIVAIGDAQRSSNTDALFALSASLGELSTSLLSSGDSLTRFARQLDARAKAIVALRNFYEKLVSVPMGPGTVANAQAFAMYESLEKLHGAVNSAAEQYRTASDSMNYYGKNLAELGHRANVSAWGILLARTAQAVQESQRAAAEAPAPATPASSPQGPEPAKSRPCTDCHTTGTQKSDPSLFKKFGGFGSGPSGQMTDEDLKKLYQFSQGAGNSPRIQPKLRISQPGDPDELEADRVADQVVSAGRSGVTSQRPFLPILPSSAPPLHRKCACSGSGTKCVQCEEEEVERARGIHRKAATNSSDSAVAPDNLLSALGSGRALEPSVGKSMESRFGQDFSGVRIHDDPAAAQSAKSINAQAHTSGSHIYFGSSSYSPQSSEGQRLLSHELVHVVQQRGRDQGIASAKSSSDVRISRKSDSSTTNTVTGPAGPPGCTIDQSRVIVPAATLSLQWLDKSAAALSRFIAAPADKSNKAVSTALQLHFHSADPGIAQRVLDRIKMIRNDIGLPRGRTELKTECHSDADTNCHDAGAYVSGSTNKLVFCPPFFKGSAQWQAKALIHEMAHSIFPPDKAHITDRAYRSDRAILRLSTTEALTNAESFALFVEELGTGKIQESAAPKDEIPDNCKDIENSLRDAIARAQRWNFNADIDVLNSASAQSVQQALGSNTPQVRKTAQTFYSNADKGFKEGFEFKCVADCGGRAARGEQKSHWLAGLGIGAAIGAGLGALVGGLIPGIGILLGAFVGLAVGAGLGWLAGHSSKIRRIQVCPAWRSQASSPAGTEAILAAAYEALGNSTADSLKYAKLAAAIQSLHPAAGTLQEIDQAALRLRLIVVQARLRKLRDQYRRSSDDFANSIFRERSKESDKRATRDVKSAARADFAAPELFGGNFAGKTIRKIVRVSGSDTTATLSANFQIVYKALSDQDGQKQAAIDIPRIENAMREVWTLKISHGEYAGVAFKLNPSVTFLPQSQKRSDTSFLIAVRGPDKDPSSGDAVHGEISLAAAHLQGSRVIVVAHELAHAFGFVDTYATEILNEKGGKKSERMIVGRTDPQNRADLLGMIDPANLDKALKKGAITPAEAARQSGPVHIWDEEASIVLRTLGVLPPAPRRPLPDDENFDPHVELEHTTREGEAKLADIRARRKRVDDAVASVNLAEEIIKLEAEEKSIQTQLAAPAPKP